jgi:hypothetical protein
MVRSFSASAAAFEAQKDPNFSAPDWSRISETLTFLSSCDIAAHVRRDGTLIMVWFDVYTGALFKQLCGADIRHILYLLKNNLAIARGLEEKEGLLL